MAGSLPQRLDEGQPVTVCFSIADDLAAARAAGKLESVHLQIRVTNIEPSLNDVRIELNGKSLPADILRLHDCIYRQYELGAIHPYGYIYDYQLTPDYDPAPGRNSVRVILVKDDPMVDVSIDVYDIDCLIKYRPHRDFSMNLTDDAG